MACIVAKRYAIVKRMQISKRLSVEGPDSEGDYELTLTQCSEGDEWHFISRAEADLLIRALTENEPKDEARK